MNELESILFLLKRYGSSKAVEGYKPFCNLSNDGSKRERVLFLFKRCDVKNRHVSLYIYTLYALGTILFGLLGLASLKPII